MVEATEASALIVRPAVATDIPAVVRMGLRFIDSSPYVAILRPNPMQIAAFTEGVLANDHAALFVLACGDLVVGMIALVTVPHYFSGDLIAQELVWWVDPEVRGAGKQLLDAAETWARESGAKSLHMIAPDARVGKLYERRGFRFVESAYSKSW